MVVIEAKNVSGTKGERLSRLAQLGVENAVKKIRLVGNLSNTSSYDYTNDEVERIEKALNGAVKEAMKQFKRKPNPTLF